MELGSGQGAFYDSGYYNIGVRPTTEDLGRGGTDGTAIPLSFTARALLNENGIDAAVPDPALFCGEGQPRALPAAEGGGQRRLQDAVVAQRRADRPVLPQRRPGDAHAGGRLLHARRRLPRREHRHARLRRRPHRWHDRARQEGRSSTSCWRSPTTASVGRRLPSTIRSSSSATARLETAARSRAPARRRLRPATLSCGCLRSASTAVRQKAFPPWARSWASTSTPTKARDQWRLL